MEIRTNTNSDEDDYLFDDLIDIDVGIDEEKIVRNDVIISRADIKTINRNRRAMKILLFLNKNSGDYTVRDLYRIFGDSENQIRTAMYHLVKVGIVEVVRSNMDNRLRYYYLVECDAKHKIIERYFRLVGFKLASLLPYEGIRINNLINDPQFVALCDKYYLSPNEGIQALKSNKYKCAVEGDLLKRRDILPTVPLEKQPQKPSEEEIGEQILSEKEEKETPSDEAADVIDLLK